MTIKIGLFAAKQVGFEIAKYLGEYNPPLCLILDSNGSYLFNENIINVAKVPTDRIYFSNELYTAKVLQSLHNFELDIMFLAWWPYILKSEIISIPRLGILNTHSSCLPCHRGKHSNFWTFIDDAPFGATIHFVDEGIDTGDIAFQSVIKKTWEDNGETLYQKVQDAVVKLFIDNFEIIKSGNIPRRNQNLCYELNPGLGSYHHSRELEPASEIHLHQKYTGKELLNLIRARTFPGYPSAWFIDGGEKYEVRIQINKVIKVRD